VQQITEQPQVLMITYLAVVWQQALDESFWHDLGE
jgi:hypothetical protein